MLTNNINTLPPQETPICLIILEAYHTHTHTRLWSQASTNLIISKPAALPSVLLGKSIMEGFVIECNNSLNLIFYAYKSLVTINIALLTLAT